MTVGESEESGDMLTASPWGMQESSTGGLQGGARDSGRDTEKSPSTAADEEGARGRHGARPGQGGKNGGRRENMGGKTSGVWGDDGGRKASGVPENPGGGRHGEGRGV